MKLLPDTPELTTKITFSIFIGAPKAKLPDNSSIEAGGIYRCYFTEECSYYKLEYNGPQKYNPNINHQMMGFAMDGHEAQNDTIIVQIRH